MNLLEDWRLWGLALLCLMLLGWSDWAEAHHTEKWRKMDTLVTPCYTVFKDPKPVMRTPRWM